MRIRCNAQVCTIAIGQTRRAKAPDTLDILQLVRAFAGRLGFSKRSERNSDDSQRREQQPGLGRCRTRPDRQDG
jgi:hypothetical protein